MLSQTSADARGWGNSTRSSATLRMGGTAVALLRTQELTRSRRAGQVYYGEDEVNFGILSSLLRWAEMAMAPGARLA